MPGIKPINLQRGKKYWVDIWWNIRNNCRNNSPHFFIGKFVKSEFVPRKVVENSNGLVLMTQPSRTLLWFNNNGIECCVSSSNTFFKIDKPTIQEVFQKYIIRQFKIAPELKRYIQKYC